MSISLYSVSTSILKVYNSLQVGLDIESIYGAIYSIYRDIAKVYYSAAKESIMAAEHSIDPASELRIAKSNLVSAYEMAKNLQNMQVKKRILIFFTTTEDVLEYNDYRSYYLNLSKLSAYISLLYRKLNEKESEKRWEEESFTQFNIFLKWMSFDYDERKSLYSTHPEYVHYWSETDITPGADRSADPDIITKSEYYDLTDSGIKYEQELKQKLLVGFQEAYKAGFIFLDEIKL